MTIRVAVYGAGQLGNGIMGVLAERPEIDASGPFGRRERVRALGSAADVVIVATTSFLCEVAPDIRDAVACGSNVIVSAEEAAYPWAVAPEVAKSIDEQARVQGVTVMGCGLNPGFAFDALVVTATGPAATVRSIQVSRTVDISRFGVTVLGRLGIGYSPTKFDEGLQKGLIRGHIGFLQSMRVVAAALGCTLEDTRSDMTPVFAEQDHELEAMTVRVGESAGFEQHDVGFIGGRPWFDAQFVAHVACASVGKTPRDEITIEGEPQLHFEIEPGLNPQSGSAAMIANSVQRVVVAQPGWLTVADLPPARP